jgi:hypothetical protein
MISGFVGIPFNKRPYVFQRKELSGWSDDARSTIIVPEISTL